MSESTKEPNIWTIEIAFYEGEIGVTPQELFDCFEGFIDQRFPDFSGVISMSHESAKEPPGV